jgi:hypothetical protein
MSAQRSGKMKRTAPDEDEGVMAGRPAVGGKRAAVEASGGGVAAAASSGAGAFADDSGDEAHADLVFEDPFEDDIESESDYEDEDDEAAEGGRAAGSARLAATGVGAGRRAKGLDKNGMEVDDEDEEDDDEDDDEEEDGDEEGAAAGGAGGAAAADAGAGGRRGKQVWRPGIDALEEGERLEFDNEAYVMYHAMAVEWPCLSFDVVPDRLGVNRTKYPLSATMVAGTQADKAANNKLFVMRVGQMYKTRNDTGA